MKKIYEEAITLSRKFKNRKIEETKKLYTIIQEAVDIANNGSKKESDQAIDFLVKVYKPYIRTIAGRYCSYYSENYLEFEDVLNETYENFLILLYKYDSNIASFSYYIKKMLPKRIYAWIDNIRSKKYMTVDIKSVEETLCHDDLRNMDLVYNYFNTAILEKEYIAYIKERSKKSNRSDTVRQVCNKIFLGNTTCSELANELQITYHAVYEVMNKIKHELIYFFGDNRFSEYTVTSTGLQTIYKY